MHQFKNLQFENCIGRNKLRVADGIGHKNVYESESFETARRETLKIMRFVCLSWIILSLKIQLDTVGLGNQRAIYRFHCMHIQLQSISPIFPHDTL